MEQDEDGEDGDAAEEEDLQHHHDEAFDPGLWAHYGAALVGAWFFMSSLVWHDGMAVRSLDWILALLVMGAAYVALRHSRRHWAISGLSQVDYDLVALAGGELPEKDT